MSIISIPVLKVVLDLVCLESDGNNRNVAYKIYKIQDNDGRIETGVIFAKSGAQEMFGIKKNTNEDWNQYLERIYGEKYGKIYSILQVKYSKRSRAWDSEAKILATMLDKISDQEEQINNYEFTLASMMRGDELTAKKIKEDN